VIVEPEIEVYAIAHTSAPDAAIAALRAETEASTPSPLMAGGPVEARLLEALVVATRATRVLEIGTFTGVSALSMASRLPPGGQLVTLGANEETAAIAQRHFDESPWGDRIELHLGNALELVHEVEGPFDLVWVDAWKRDYAVYYEAVLPKLADHGVIVADNVLRSGSVVDPETDDEDTLALRAFADLVQADERVDNALLTVGDGLLVIWKRQVG
jgi:caffeoyl-CoA O-methyltransferase